MHGPSQSNGSRSSEAPPAGSPCSRPTRWVFKPSVDEEVAPYAFVHIRGHVTLSEDLEELLRFATAIGGRYMGADRAEEFGRRNAVPGELLVRLRPKRVIATADVAGY